MSSYYYIIFKIMFLLMLFFYLLYIYNFQKIENNVFKKIFIFYFLWFFVINIIVIGFNGFNVSYKYFDSHGLFPS